MPADSSFVTAFSDLAHASIAEKCPGLMEYLVGFQLIDKNDEDTHAIGVFGFKVGNQWFYAPVFFLNGTLKGMELLYVKGQDLFVPLQDNWVNYLLSKQPRKLGQTEQVPEQKLNITQPDFRVFSESPGTSGTKWASVLRTDRVQAWAHDFLPAYHDVVSQTKKASNTFGKYDLRETLRQHPALAAPLAATMRHDMKFAEAVLRFYDIHDLLPPASVVKRAAENLKNPLTATCAQSSVGGGLKAPKMSLPRSAESKVQMPVPNPAVKASSVKEAGYVGDNHKWGYSKHYVGTDAVLASLTEFARGHTKQAADEKSPNEAEAKVRKDEKPEDADVDSEQRIMRGKDSPDVQIFTHEDSPSILTELSDKEKEQLRKGEIVIRDHRDNTSTVYNAEFDRHMTNPTETGVYDVLTSVKGLERCFVITDPKTIGKGRSSGVVTLVSLEGNKYGSFRNIDVLVNKAEQAKDSFGSRFDEVYKKAKDLSSMKSGYMYVLVGPDGKASIPFKYLTNVASNDGTVQYYVKPDTFVCSARSSVRGTLDRGWERANGKIVEDEIGGHGPCCEVAMPSDPEKRRKLPYDEWELNNARVILSSDRANVSTLKNVGAMSIVPADRFKALEIGRANRYPEDDAKDVIVKLDPGTLADAESYILKLGAEQLMVYADGPELILQSGVGQMRLNKEAALATLVLGWGLKQEAATDIVKSASKAPKEYLVKLAQGLDSPPTAPYPPPYLRGYNQQIGVPIEEQQTHFQPVLGMIPKAENRNAYTLFGQKPVYQMAMDAAQKGDKDVFDTSVIGGLVKAVDVDGMIDSFLPDMIKGMDRVGRALFMFYWHNEQFKERYGRQELVDLEDSLRSVLKSMGDLVIFLKQKGSEADPMFESQDINLDSVSDQ